jgi:hypothetical protein
MNTHTHTHTHTYIYNANIQTQLIHKPSELIFKETWIRRVKLDAESQRWIRGGQLLQNLFLIVQPALCIPNKAFFVEYMYAHSFTHIHTYRYANTHHISPCHQPYCYLYYTLREFFILIGGREGFKSQVTWFNIHEIYVPLWVIFSHVTAIRMLT